MIAADRGGLRIYMRASELCAGAPAAGVDRAEFAGASRRSEGKPRKRARSLPGDGQLDGKAESRQKYDKGKEN